LGGRFRLAVLAAGLTVAVAFGMAATPARADGGILGDIGKVSSFASSVSKFYDLFNDYILGHKSIDLQQVQAAILQSRDAIVSQIDAVATADVACSATAVEQFGNIDKTTKPRCRRSWPATSSA